MSDASANIHLVLQNAGYDTWDAAAGEIPVVAFEDAAVMGFACVFSSAEALLTGWAQTESTLLSRHAAHLRRAGDKAWNVYCALLATSRATDDERRQVRWIEENLERTRKITATGVATREDVAVALLPLLPIVSKPVLAQEEPTHRLLRRIGSLAPEIEDIVLDESVSPRDVVRRIRGGEE
jgi:hypothetical protein